MAQVVNTFFDPRLRQGGRNYCQTQESLATMYTMLKKRAMVMQPKPPPCKLSPCKRFRFLRLKLNRKLRKLQMKNQSAAAKAAQRAEADDETTMVLGRYWAPSPDDVEMAAAVEEIVMMETDL